MAPVANQEQLRTERLGYLGIVDSFSGLGFMFTSTIGIIMANDAVQRGLEHAKIFQTSEWAIFGVGAALLILGQIRLHQSSRAAIQQTKPPVE